MNNFFLSITLALRSFRSNISRSLLTLFGIMIGILMVIVVFSAGNGVRSIIYDEISSFGSNWIDIEVKVPSAAKNSTENASALGRGVEITSFTLDDVKAIQKLPGIRNIYAGITSQVTLQYRDQIERPTVFGVTAPYVEINKSAVEYGRFFDEYDDESASQVIVLGYGVRDTLFGDQDPIGESVSVNGTKYEVIGVMESIGTTGFIDMDTMVYIPLETVQKKIMGVSHIMFSIGEMSDSAQPLDLTEEIRYLLRDRHGIDDPDKEDFSVTTLVEAVSIVGTVVTAVTWLLVGLAAISLVVAGVGIMNVMYVSVAERTFEIGLRKSVGASDRHILLQFLTEALVITCAGGLLGVIFGILLSYGIASVARVAGLAWTFSISLFSIVIAVLFSVLIGVVFGVYPAKKAASLEPIAALREE